MTERTSARPSPILPADRLGASTLMWRRRPVEWAIRRAAVLGFAWVDLGIIEPMTGLGPPQLLEDFESILSRWRQALSESGVRVASFNARLTRDADPHEKQREADALARAAAALEVSAGVTLGHGPADDIQPTLDHLRPILRVFEDLGQTLMVESHQHNWTEDPGRARQLLDALPGLRFTLDAAHYLAQGYTPDDWAPLMPDVRHVHVRPAARGSIHTWTDDRDPAFDRWLQQMAAGDYRGCYCFELIDQEGEQSEPEALQLREQLQQGKAARA